MYSGMRGLSGIRNRLVLVASVLACAGAFTGPAYGSQVIARNATNVQLAVNAQGVALVTFRERGGGRARHVPRPGGGQAVAHDRARCGERTRPPAAGRRSAGQVPARLHG